MLPLPRPDFLSVSRRSVRNPFPSLPPYAYRQLPIWIDCQYWTTRSCLRSSIPMADSPPSHDVLSPLLRPEFLSVSLKSSIPVADSPPSHDVLSLLLHPEFLSVSLKSGSGSSVELEPLVITYVTALQKTSSTHNPTLRLFSLHYTLDSSQEPSMTQRNAGAGSHAGSRWRLYNPTLIASTSRSLAPYLNTPISAVSTSPPHSTHPNVRHTHTTSDVIQCRLCPVTHLVGKSSTHVLFDYLSRA